MVRKPREPRRGRRALRVAALAALLLAAALLSLFAGGYVSVARTLPSLEIAGRIASPESTKIYDSSTPPVLLAELRGLENREVLSGDRIPQVARDAVVAIEDPRFYEHKGVDFIAILRAAWANLRDKDVVTGGSDITQQLIKNAFLSERQTSSSPTLEPMLAYTLESRWTKERILNEYLNVVYFGSDAYGIQAAARTYFGVDAKQLTVAQAALLAGLIDSPSTFSPRRDPGAALARRALVLNRMYQQRFVSSRQLQEALEAPLRLAQAGAGEEASEPAWVELVREQLIARYGSSTVMGGGLRVHTSLDLRLQQAAREAIHSVLHTPAPSAGPEGDSGVPTDMPEAVLVAIDVHTGRLVTMAGGAEARAGDLELATEDRRNLGSAFQPLILATALERGISPQATYDSGSASLERTTDMAGAASCDGDSVTLAKGLADSSDEVFVRLLGEVGVAAVAQTAADLGLPTSAGTPPSPADALAGPATGVTPLEAAMAYFTLATGGERLSQGLTFDPLRAGYPVSITRVTDRDGRLIDENGVSGQRVIDRGIAELTTECLRGVVDSGTGRAAGIGRPAAGKTGISSDRRNAWFIGYTPELLAAVWVGYLGALDARSAEIDPADSGAGDQSPQRDGTPAAQIWARFMSTALAGVPVTDFSTSYAAKWMTVAVCGQSHLLPTELCPSVVQRLFRSEELPGDTCGVHVPQAVFMPDVVGVSATKAKKTLDEAKLKVKTVGDSGSLQPAGVVVRQDHVAGTPILQGSQVILHVSTGQAREVPRLVGRTLDEARTRLTTSGLGAEVTEQASDTVPVGVVVSQDPAAGRVVGKGTAVRVVVSSGPAVIEPTTPPSS